MTNERITSTLTLSVPAIPVAIGAARHSCDSIEAFIAPQALEYLQLLLSELVTNSIRHSGSSPAGRINITVEVLPSKIRAAVADPGPGFDPTLIPTPTGSPRGWGLHLVNQLSDRWGVDHNTGTTVWFELDRPAA